MNETGNILKLICKITDFGLLIILGKKLVNGQVIFKSGANIKYLFFRKCFVKCRKKLQHKKLSLGSNSNVYKTLYSQNDNYQ